jgi:hypothetical protein
MNMCFEIRKGEIGDKFFAHGEGADISCDLLEHPPRATRDGSVI